MAASGSEGHVALKCNRRFVGIELKPSYFKTAARNLTAAREKGFKHIGVTFQTYGRARPEWYAYQQGHPELLHRRRYRRWQLGGMVMRFVRFVVAGGALLLLVDALVALGVLAWLLS